MNCSHLSLFKLKCDTRQILPEGPGGKRNEFKGKEEGEHTPQTDTLRTNIGLKYLFSYCRNEGQCCHYYSNTTHTSTEVSVQGKC